MAKRKQTDEVDPEEIKKQLDSLSRDAVKTSSLAFNTFSKFQKQRAARLNQGLKQIKKDLGSDNPDYASAQVAMDRAATLNKYFASQSARVKNRPKTGPNEWIVFGQVLDASGAPAKGLRVRVFDRDRKFDDLLGDTLTNEHGDFSVIYHERDFFEVGENLPELYVMVSDAKNKVLYTSRDDLRFNAGRSEYFWIQLGKAAASRANNTAR